MEDFMLDLSLFQALTFGVAMVGAVLGIINTWRTRDRDSPKVLVGPAQAFPFGGAKLTHSNIGFSIEVVNRSSFALIIIEVGVCFRHAQGRGAFISPVTVDGKTYPHKLEARDAVIFYVARPEAPSGDRITRAYARTACGLTFYGTSPALKQLNA